LGIPTASEIDVCKNFVKIYVEDRTQFDKVVSEGKISVNVITVEKLVYLETKTYGGLTLTTRTSGFAVKNSSGTKVITTDAHCNNSKIYNRSSLTFQSENYGTYYDIQWHTAPGFTVTNKVRFPLGTFNITAAKSRSQQQVGNWVEKYGKSSGYTAGYISSLTFKPGTQFQATFIRVKNTAGYSDLPRGGDSGYPWFNLNTAWRSHCGSPGDDSNDAYYMAINYVSGIGVSVMTFP
jgi:hypothetical protein